MKLHSSHFSCLLKLLRVYCVSDDILSISFAQERSQHASTFTTRCYLLGRSYLVRVSWILTGARSIDLADLDLGCCGTFKAIGAGLCCV